MQVTRSRKTGWTAIEISLRIAVTTCRQCAQLASGVSAGHNRTRHSSRPGQLTDRNACSRANPGRFTCLKCQLVRINNRIEHPLVRRRITHLLGAAAGGLLVVTLLPITVAHADTYEILPAPNSPEEITGFFGLPTTPPAVASSFQGQQVFELFDKTTGQAVGTFEADESTNSSLFGAANQLLLVTKDLTGTVGTATGDTPTVGSVINIADYGNGYERIYSDLASPDGDVITHNLIFPSKTYSFPAHFDAALGLGTDTVDTTPVQLGDGYYLGPAAGVPETITSVTGFPPVTIAVEGNQLFNVFDTATDQPVGAFQGVVTNTADLAANYTQEILVTQDISGTVGTAAGDTPPVDSLYNIFYFFGSNSIYNLYSVTPSESGNIISDTLVTPHHDFTIPIPFDATTALTVNSITLPSNGETIVPVGSELISGVNGVPPLNSEVQGYQLFDLNDADGSTIGTFDADVSTTTGFFGGYSEQLLVTADSGAAGIDPGDLPPVGSEFDVMIYPGGIETIYSDLISTTGANVISETLVTPLGDFTIPTTTDLAAHIADATFFVPTWLAELAPNLF